MQSVSRVENFLGNLFQVIGSGKQESVVAFFAFRFSQVGLPKFSIDLIPHLSSLNILKLQRKLNSIMLKSALFLFIRREYRMEKLGKKEQEKSYLWRNKNPFLGEEESNKGKPFYLQKCLLGLFKGYNYINFLRLLSRSYFLFILYCVNTLMKLLYIFCQCYCISAVLTSAKVIYNIQ